MFQMSKINSFKITRMFTLFINKAFNNSNCMHLLASWKNIHSCFLHYSQLIEDESLFYR